MGYSAGSSDCIMSFSRWQKLIAARIENVVRPAVWAGLRVAVASLKKGLLSAAHYCAAIGREILSPEWEVGPKVRQMRPKVPGFLPPVRISRFASRFVRHAVMSVALARGIV